MKKKIFIHYILISILATILTYSFTSLVYNRLFNKAAFIPVMSIVLIEYAGIHAKGTRKWLHSFAEPVAVIAPLNVLEIFIRPLSLCMRLFGNVLGAFVIMELIKIIVPVIIPAVFSVYFDLFDGLLQAYVFVFLTSLYISEEIE